MSRQRHEPRLYRGIVTHDRVRPRRNRFRYGVYFVYVPVDGSAEAFSSVRLFSRNRPNVFSLWDQDHGTRDGGPLRPWIDEILRTANIDLSGGTVMLLAFPRVLGARFFPVSFWYCFHEDGTLRAVLAEVHNTFRQHHNYLVHADGASLERGDHPTASKVLHVSPFISMDAEYRFSFSEPGDGLSAWIDDIVEGEHLLLAALDLEAHPLTDRSLLATLGRLGPMSIRALVLIHWQALRLALKRVGFYGKPPAPEKETSL